MTNKDMLRKMSTEDLQRMWRTVAVYTLSGLVHDLVEELLRRAKTKGILSSEPGSPPVGEG